MSNLTLEDLKLIGDLFDSKLDDKLDVVSANIKGIHIQMDAEFKTVNERLHNLDQRLEKVEIQTTKTNGRVTDLEKGQPQHLLSCPQIEKIAELEKKVDNNKKENDDNLIEYTIFKKYPKVGLGIIIVTCILLFMGGYLTYTKFAKELKQDVDIENVSDTKSDSLT